MKKIIAAVLIAILFASCSKNNDVKPNNGNTNNNNNNTNNPSNPSLLTADDSLHMAVFYALPQIVKTSVTGKNLIMKLDENVSLFFLAEGYKKISAIHLKEDLKSTSLAGFEFTTIAEGGNATLNWVDDNLNNVKFKSVKDTVIDHVNVVKVNVNRTFTFFKVYAKAQDAIDEQNKLVNTTGQLITFTSYTYYNQKNYPKTSAVAYVQYLR